MDDRHQGLSDWANGARKMWAAVVLAAIDDAITEDRKTGKGVAYLIRWARSRDGRDVLNNAGIDPNERAISGLVAYVEKGVKTSSGLTLKNAEA